MQKDKDQRKEEIDSLKPLLKQVENLKTLTKEEERDLIAKAQAGDKRAMDQLVKRNLRLVVHKAKKFMDKGVPLMDLVQEGSTGIIRAVEKFELDRNLKLSTYAVRWIEQRIRRVIEKRGRIIKIPANKLAEITAVKKAYKKYSEVHNKNPNSTVLAEILGISKDKVEELGRMLYQHVSLDESAGEDENLSMVDYIVDEHFLPDEHTESLADKEYVAYLLNFLTKKDRDFIRLKFGFLDGEERTDRQMSILLKMTIKDVKATEARVLAQLSEKANIHKVNFPVLCDIVLTEVPPGAKLNIINTLYNISSHSKTTISTLVNSPPSVLFDKVDQHRAVQIMESLEDAGAVVEITPSVLK